MTTPDMSDPRTRAAMAERMTPAEYNAAMEAWRASRVVSTVNGHPIRAVDSARWGRLYQVGNGTAYTTVAAAEKHAAGLPKEQRA